MRMLAYRLILPAIWLNTLFGNQLWYPDILWIGRVSYWISLGAVVLVVLRAFGTRIWPYFLLAVIVASRLALLGKIPGAQLIYLGSTFSLFVVAGVLLAIHAPEVLQAQSRKFFLLSIPVMVFQVAGIAEWLQAFNTLYAVTGPNENIIRPTIRMLPLLFTSEAELMSTRYSDFYEFLSMQARPPGLTHSSAMLAVFILAGAALHLGRLKGRSITWDDFIIVFAVVVSGAKLALVGFVLVSCWTYIRSEAVLRRRVRRVFGLLAALLVVYAMVFPAALLHNLGVGAIERSFFVRGVDALLRIAPEAAWQLPAVVDVIGTFHTSFSDEETFGKGALSGVATLFYTLPFLTVAGLLGLPWIVRGLRHCRVVSPETGRTAELMAIVVLMAPFATPIIDSQFYPLCVGIAFMPIAGGFSARLRRRLLRSAQLRANVKGGTSVILPRNS